MLHSARRSGQEPPAGACSGGPRAWAPTLGRPRSFQSWLQGAAASSDFTPGGGGGQLKLPRGLWQHFRQCVSCWSISKSPLLPPARSPQ